MVTKTLTITEKAYELLKMHKLPGESFSQAIIRLLSKGGSIDALYGAWEGDDQEWAEIEERMRASWNNWGTPKT